MSANKRRLMGEINVVPYIDVMLVLLIIFMVTAPLLTQGIEVNLPEADAAPLDGSLTDDELPIVLSVDRDGALYLNAGADKESPIAAADVINRVQVILDRRPGTPVLVKADQSVPYGRVVFAMVLLQKGGAEQVGFITDPLDPESLGDVSP
ncbi:MAG: protein TolR [Pseudomonadota bacterium]